MSSQSGSQLIEYDSECYEVECIRERKIIKGKKHYFIKWKDWQEKYNTWQPIENLQTVLGMVNAFQKNLQQGSGGKKDCDKATSSKQSVSNEGVKKTKQIQKQKKKRKNEQESEQSQSESQVVQTVEIKEKKVKKDQKKEVKKLANNKNINNQISTEKQRPSIKEKQKQLEKPKFSKEQKEKERQKQISPNRKVQSGSSTINNNNKTAQPSTSSALNKQPSKTASQSFSNPGDIVQISRINYHIMIPPQMPHLPAKLFYNVDRRNRITKKPLAVVDVSSEELLQKHPQMIVHYLENFVKQVEYYSYQKREYENRQNLQNQTLNQNGKTLLLQAKK